MTDAERLLWYELKGRRFCGFKFRRQRPIGPYIVDFCCMERALVIELDGGQHNEPESIAYDQERTRFLEREHFRVVRFWDNEVFVNTEGVFERIFQLLTDPSLICLPASSPLRGEGKGSEPFSP